MSAPDRHAYDDIIVVGGGCYGSYYVEQLRRARAAGAIDVRRVRVVDRNAECAVARTPTDAELVVAEWTTFFEDYLGASSEETRDAIVPSPLMPHLMYGWLLERARKRWPDRSVETVPLAVEPGTPWSRSAPDATHYVSYATWECPINCVEPRLCPHTRGERSWTMPDAARDIVERAAEAGGDLQGPVIFHCTHRAFGVGMFDTRDVVTADEFVRTAAAESAADVLVGTVSHCHGALNVLRVGAKPAA
jgi:hypothetical protein